MKQLWILGLVCAFQWSAVQAAPVAVSAPKLVVTDFDGPCDLTWSPDGRLVGLNPINQRQELKWGWCFLAADGTSPSSKTVKDYLEAPPFKLQQYMEEEGKVGENSSVEVYSRLQSTTRPLQNTPGDLFGFDMDSLSYGWRFQDSRFSADGREVSIIAEGTIYTWSISTGKLLRRVPLAVSQSQREKLSFASFSKDGCFVISGSNAEPSGAALFDARSGRKIFALSNQCCGFKGQS